MSTFCAGVCARISEGRVEFLCRQVYREGLGNIFVFPGDNRGPKENPEEILRRAFVLKTGMLPLSSSLVFVHRQTKENGEIVFSQFFWLVTDYCEDLTKEGEFELPQGVSLVWMRVDELRNLIFFSHKPALLSAINRLSRLDEEFARALLYFCPDLFPVL